MKYYLLFLFITGLSIVTVRAQDLSSKSQQELIQMKEQAVKEQDFHLAQSIKAEMQSRKSIDDLILEKQAEIKKAVEGSEYAKAEELKNEVERLKERKEKISELEGRLNRAVEEEQYLEAQQIKEQIEELKNPDSSSPKEGEKKTSQQIQKSTAVKSIEPEEEHRDDKRKRLKIQAGLTFGGLNFTSDDPSNDLADYSGRLGFLIGSSMEFPIADNFSVEPSIAIVNIAYRTAELEYYYRLNYFSLQAVGRYTFPFSGYVGAGVYVDLGMFGSQTMPSGKKIKIFAEEAINRLNSGLVGEAGYPVTLGHGKEIELFLAYRLGLNDTEGKFDQDNQKGLLRMFSLGGRLFL